MKTCLNSFKQINRAPGNRSAFLILAACFLVAGFPRGMQASAGGGGYYTDGISAAWRTQYFGSDCSSGRCAATADPDGDGAINYREFLDGTDPTNPASVRTVPISLQTYLGSEDGGRDGYRSEATFSQPETVHYDSFGRLWITEGKMVDWYTAAGVQRIRLMESNGFVRTVAGGNSTGYADGLGNEVRFGVPQKLVTDAAGNAYVSDRLNNRIRKVSPSGYVTTYAGGEAGNVDGPLDKARFSGQIGITIDSGNNLYVADFMNNQVRKISADGMVSTIAHILGAHDVALDEQGNLYVTGWTEGNIYKVSPGGQISLFARSVPYATYIERDKQGRIYATTGSPEALHCYSPTGTLLWRLQVSPGPDYLPSTPSVTHIGKIEFMADGNILFPNNFSHQIMLLKIGPEPLVRFQLQDSSGGGSEVAISTPIAQGQIHYTWDGSDPTMSSPLYTTPVAWDKKAQIKAQVFLNGFAVSEKGFFSADESSARLLAQRSLPEFYQPGVPFLVTIATTPAVDGVIYAVEDRVPSGWSAGNISHGGSFDTVNSKVKFGPFFDHEPRQLNYTVTSPSNSGMIGLFQGIMADDKAEVAIQGMSQTTPALHHPADNDPADWRITLQEMTRYAGAWKNGQAWPSGPNPIPIDYVTRAAAIWQVGETYSLNNAITNLPGAWVNKSSAPQPQ